MGLEVREVVAVFLLTEASKRNEVIYARTGLVQNRIIYSRALFRTG